MSLSRFGWKCRTGAFAVALLLAGCVQVNTDVQRNVLVEGSDAGPLLSAEQLPLNVFQFYGSHNSYKTAMSPQVLEQLRKASPEAALALEYWHEPIFEQLDLGLRVLELDVFYDPQQDLFSRGGVFPVLHVQSIDTGSHCAELQDCLQQITRWSDLNEGHEPILISFNAKTQKIDLPGSVVPHAFDVHAWRELDAVLRHHLGSKLLNPAQVLTPDGPRWPKLGDARGAFLLLLDEGAVKHEAYLQAVAKPAMFANLPEDDPRSAIRVLNDPLADAALIAEAIKQGRLVRTRADADTREARVGDTRRRDAAFSSGAHFVSTDYYRVADHFGSNYSVALPGGGAIGCNPKAGTRELRKACSTLLRHRNPIETQ